MSDVTALLAIGPLSGAFGSDHFQPTHVLLLSENDRPAWRLVTLSDSAGITWVPHAPETIVEDAMLMTALHVFEDEGVRQMASSATPSLMEERVDLHLEGDPDLLGKLYGQVRALPPLALVVITVLAHSSLRDYIDQFQSYQIETRICREG